MSVVRPEVAAWHGGGGREPITRRTVSLGDPATVQTWRLVGFTDSEGAIYALDDQAAAERLLSGLWTLVDEVAVMCGCAHPSDVHAEGRGRCARSSCGCSGFHLPRGGLVGGLRC